VTSESAIATVLKFEQLINLQKPEAVCSLLAEDSVFIDSLGNRVEGLARLRSAWEGYFKMVPYYAISHEEIFATGNTVAMFGMAQGTFHATDRSGKRTSGRLRQRGKLW
jgi:ketosteroid isomerase-like protein